MLTPTITLQQIHKDITTLQTEIRSLRALIEEDLEIADDVLEEIEQSRSRPTKDFIPHDQLRREFLDVT